MSEYHVDTLPPFLRSRGSGPFGASLSVRKRGRPLIIPGQDKSIMCQWIFSKKGWTCHGKGTLKPKTDGEGIMMSAFISDAHGFSRGIDFPLNLLPTINVTGVGNNYVSVESAEAVNDSAKKKVLMVEMFQGDMVHSPFFHMCFSVAPPKRGIGTMIV
jgi:hypothetical protein